MVCISEGVIRNISVVRGSWPCMFCRNKSVVTAILPSLDCICFDKSMVMNSESLSIDMSLLPVSRIFTLNASAGGIEKAILFGTPLYLTVTFLVAVRSVTMACVYQMPAANSTKVRKVSASLDVIKRLNDCQPCFTFSMLYALFKRYAI